jgi:hypothetical protein
MRVMLSIRSVISGIGGTFFKLHRLKIHVSDDRRIDRNQFNSARMRSGDAGVLAAIRGSGARYSVSLSNPAPGSALSACAAPIRLIDPHETSRHWYGHRKVRCRRIKMSRRQGGFRISARGE